MHLFAVVQRAGHGPILSTHSLPSCGSTSAAHTKADSTLRSSRAVPHPSTNRALRRLTAEFRRDPVHSTRYGRQRRCSVCAGCWRQRRAGLIIVACWAASAQFRSRVKTSLRFPGDQQGYQRVHVHLPSPFPLFLAALLRSCSWPCGGRRRSEPSEAVHVRISFPARLGAAARSGPCAAPIPGSPRCSGSPFPAPPTWGRCSSRSRPVGFPSGLGCKFRRAAWKPPRCRQNRVRRLFWSPISKLTWLVLGEDPAARSHRVEQFTAL